MTEAQAIPQPTVATTPPKRTARSMFAGLEVDNRLLGLVAALVILWLAFNMLSGGLFLTPRNLWNLSVQSAAVAIMTTGMVLIIVSRNIDLSIGSSLVFIVMVMGLLQAEWIPNFLGAGFDRTFLWIIVVGRYRRWRDHRQHPGLPRRVHRDPIVHRDVGRLRSGGAAFRSAGLDDAPLDSTFQLLGGGPRVARETRVGSSARSPPSSWVGRESTASTTVRLPAPTGWADITLGVAGPRSSPPCGSPTPIRGLRRWPSSTRSTTGSPSRQAVW
jgi:hypothetical protein